MKKARIALALLALPFVAGATFVPSDAMPNPFFINLNLVEKLNCENGVSGSGARIDASTVITAHHVLAKGHSCVVAGSQTEVTYDAEKLDFTTLHSPKFTVNESRMVINCDGIERGRRYYGIGYAFGSELVVQQLIGTDAKRTKLDPRFGGMAILKGNAYHGMSGGPVVNEIGEVVAIVNGGLEGGISYTLARELSTTYLCKGGVE